jgi:tryptophan-rich sensory protein
MKFDFYLLWIVIPLFLGFIIGSIGKPDEWYEKLKKPLLNPPRLVFPIAWTILYILIGISYYYGLYKKELKFWIIPIIHLLFNFAYSPIFFYYKQKLGAAILTTLIFILAIMTLIQFKKTNKTMISVYLIIPYLLWLVFANYLAWSIYYLNNGK